MARARNIKPGYFENELLGAADPLVSLLFAALWCLADRKGRLEDRPLRIKAFAFPYREGIDANALLAELARLGFITRYTVAGRALIQVAKFHEHQKPHSTERASTLPGPDDSAAVTVNPPLTHGEPTQAERPDSLIPDSPIVRLSDSPNHPLAPAPGGAGPADSEPVKRRAAKPVPAGDSPTNRTWGAYAHAYERRYGAPPVRNAVVNGKLANLIARLGAEEAPHVAYFFVAHNGAQYVRGGHDVGLLLRDCEALRTQWATNRRITEGQARQMDRAATTADAFAALLEQAEAAESTTHP